MPRPWSGGSSARCAPWADGKPCNGRQGSMSDDPEAGESWKKDPALDTRWTMGGGDHEGRIYWREWHRRAVVKVWGDILASLTEEARRMKWTD